ncbi:MAG: hypothetical protein R3C19_07010 [Planctomycetaceae bacterium]
MITTTKPVRTSELVDAVSARPDRVLSVKREDNGKASRLTVTLVTDNHEFQGTVQ